MHKKQKKHKAMHRGASKIESAAILIASVATLAFAYFLITAFFYGPGFWF